MKQNMLYFLLLISVTLFAQKSDVIRTKMTFNHLKNDYFKNIKTYNIIVTGGNWGSGFFNVNESGEEFANPKTGTYEHLMSNKFLDQLEIIRDTIDPDIRIFASYNGKFPNLSSNNSLVLEGSFRYLILNKKDELLFADEENLIKYYILYKEEYPGQKGKDFHISMANALKLYSVEKLNELGIGVSKLEENVPNAIFEKIRDNDELTQFNSKVEELLNEVSSNGLSQNKAQTYKDYFSAFLNKDLGKLKEKHIQEAVNTNVLLASVFSGEKQTTLNMINNEIENAGIFTLWPKEFKSIFDKFHLLDDSKPQLKINIHPKVVDVMIVEGKLYYKDEVFEGKFKIDRFINSDDYKISRAKSNIAILNDEGITKMNIQGDDTVTITTIDGESLVFKNTKATFRLFLKMEDKPNCYKTYKAHLGDINKIYCFTGDEYVIQN